MLGNRYIVYIVMAMFLACTGCQAFAPGQPGGAVGRHGLSAQIRNEIQPYALDIISWELSNLLTADITGTGSGTRFSDLPSNISAVLVAENITVCPRVRVKLVDPPLLLVISPRDRIAYFDRVLLLPGLSAEDINRIEEKVDTLDLSSLVVSLGGFGAAYPAIVSADMPDKYIINAAVEEWAHQYLVFRPLGFLYLCDALGIRQDPEVIVMNETLAGMIAGEIGSKVYKLYYAGTDSGSRGPDQAAFDFDREMRETRRKVDILLDAGSIDEAERYMKERQIEFNRQGHAIRKLNQAYFAFHGIYGQDPGAVSPVYRNMLEIRKNYTSLAAFVDKISGLTCSADLESAVNGAANKL